MPEKVDGKLFRFETMDELVEFVKKYEEAKGKGCRWPLCGDPEPCDGPGVYAPDPHTKESPPKATYVDDGPRVAEPSPLDRLFQWSRENAMFMVGMEVIANRVHNTAVEKGWWEKERNDGEMIALMHSELSEALEGLRHGNPASEKIPEFTCAEEEFADVLIRIMDTCLARGWNLPAAVLAKMDYNEGREYKHGGKLF